MRTFLSAGTLPSLGRETSTATPRLRMDLAQARLLGALFCPREAGMRSKNLRNSFALGAAALAIASAWVPMDGHARPFEPGLQRLIGVYRFVGGDQEVVAVERAIDEAVDEMSFLIRGMARRRLKEPNLPADEIRISLDDGAITVARAGQPPVSAPATGDRVTWQNPRNGNELEVAHRVTDDGALRQILIGDRGVSTNIFRSSKDGRLVVETTIDADKLPSTIRFSTTYARK